MGLLRSCVFVLPVMAFSLSAKDGYFIESGLGIEYGGLGVQFHLPSASDKLDLYVSSGLFYWSSRSGEQIGVGAGVNYLLEPNHALSAYVGTLNVERYWSNSAEIKHRADYGLSLGYKYFFSGEASSGFVVGANFNVYNDRSYPSLSAGYRF